MGEFLGLTARRAASTPDGQWIRTPSNWHELQLAQRRMPTRQELDSAAPDNPVLVKRGGHNDPVNSAGLRLAGVTASWDGEHARQAMRRPDPARGHQPPRHGRSRSP